MKPADAGQHPPGETLTDAAEAGEVPEAEGGLVGRRATEALLEETAVRLLKRDGILAGLNLREVADQAGVNRGLVYHYFGSRGRLLRRALRRRGEETLKHLLALEGLPFVPRQLRFLRTMIAHSEAVRLRTLLLLDGTEPVKMMPLRERTQSHLRQDVSSGDMAPGLDLAAVHSFLVTSVYGYVLYREAFAAEFGVATEVLDERYAELYGRVLASFAPQNAERKAQPKRAPGRTRPARPPDPPSHSENGRADHGTDSPQQRGWQPE